MFAAACYKTNELKQYCKEKTVDSEKVGQVIEQLPTFTIEQVQAHNKDSDRIWVSFKNGVYDITDFILSHPGGDKIVMAAGDSIEPYWNIYGVHHSKHVYEMLESLRIGNLQVDEAARSKALAQMQENDPYRNEPARNPLLKVLTKKPFNAESPKELSVETLVTPNAIHFVRNHMPVPHINPEGFQLEIVDELNNKSFKISLEDLKSKFTHHTVI